MEILQHRLEEVKKEAAVDKEAEVSKKDVKDNVTLDDDLKDNLDSSLDDALENNLEEALATNSEDNNIASDYDVILQVKPEKIPKIKAQIIDGQKCIVIPIDENEQTTVNGLNDLI